MNKRLENLVGMATHRIGRFCVDGIMDLYLSFCVKFSETAVSRPITSHIYLFLVFVIGK